MGVSSLWPLLLLILVPAIILLYILKQEAVEKRISSTLLWQEVYRNMEATKPWEKLKRNLLMLLQILTVLFFVLVLMGPWLKSLGTESGMLILVVDNSASMQTLYRDTDTRLDTAIASACGYVDSAPAGTSFYIITANDSAVLLLSGDTDKLEAKNRLKSIGQTDLSGNVSSAMGLVQSCIAQSEDASVVYFTDTAFDGGGIPAVVENCYSQQDNVCLERVNAARQGEEMLVLVSVENFGQTDITSEINLYGITSDGKKSMLDIGSVSAAAGENTAVYMTEPIEKMDGITALCAELNEKDALEADNRSFCVLEEAETRNILLVSSSNLFLEKAFSILPNTELYRTKETDLSQADGEYDLFVFDGIVPDAIPSSGNLLFINCEIPDIAKNCGKLEGKKLSFVDSEVTGNLTDHSFGVNQAMTYEIPSWGKSCLKHQEDCCGFYGVYEGHKIVALGFDLHQTDFGLKTDFPVFISNLSEYLLKGSLLEKNLYTIGASVPFHASSRGKEIHIKHPDGTGESLDLTESGSSIRLDQTGIWTVSQQVEEQKLSQQVAVVFPKTESNVNPVTEMAASDGEVVLSVHKGALPLRNYLLAALLLLMAAEWFVYIRMQ